MIIYTTGVLVMVFSTLPGRGRYLLHGVSAEFLARSVPQREGRSRYVVDQLANPHT